MKKTFLAWVVFFTGILLGMLVDYLMRSRDGDIQTDGLSPTIWSLIQIVLAVIALNLAFSATKPLQKWWKRVLVVLVQGTVAFGVYLYMGLSYICGTGIDCF